MAAQLCLIYTWENSVTHIHFITHKQKHSFANYLVNPLNFSEAVRLLNKFYLAWIFDLAVYINWRHRIIKKSTGALVSYIQLCIIKLSLMQSGMKFAYSIWDTDCNYYYLIVWILQRWGFCSVQRLIYILQRIWETHKSICQLKRLEVKEIEDQTAERQILLFVSFHILSISGLYMCSS